MIVAGLVFGATPAAAQVEACHGALALAEWHDAMDAVDAALVELDGDRADRILDDIVYEMRCLGEPVPPLALGRLARQVSLVAFYAQDPEEMRYWALLARETAGEAPWPEALPIPERFLALVEALPTPDVARADGGLVVPRGGGALLDGYLVLEPVATVGVQHLLQVADRHGRVVATQWQTGPAFDAGWLGPDARLPDPPKWYVAPLPPPAAPWDPEPDDAVAEAPEPEPVPAEPEPVPAEPEPVPAEPEPVPAEPEPVPDDPDARRGAVRFDGDGTTAACPWKVEPRTVVARGGWVRVNRHTFPVRSGDDQDAFREVLRACGEFRAVRRFTRWRTARKAWFRDGSSYRDAMVDALLTPEPARKPKKPAAP